MKTFLCVLLVLSLVPSLSCSKAVAPNNAQPPDVKPAPVASAPTPPSAIELPAITPPVSPPSSTAPPRLDPSLPSLSYMKLKWAADELPFYGLEMDFGRSSMSKEDAINRGKAWFTSHNVRKVADVDSIQAILVRYTADAHFSQLNKPSWFIVAPPIMGLQLLGPSATVPTRDTPVKYFWADDVTLLMYDDGTGELWGGTPRLYVGHVAPQLTINQFDVVQKYVDSYGWWAAWYRLNEYNGQTVPQSVVDAMRF